MWTLSEVWNNSLEQVAARKPEAREHLWASELGKSPIDLYLKLRGTPISNEPNARSLRKFEAGNTFEWIVALILKRAGILIDGQKHLKHQYPGMLEVTGRVDFLAGGKPNLEQYQNFKAEIGTVNLPEGFLRAGEAITKYLAENYPDGLPETPLEIKSVSAFMFEAMQKNQRSLKGHRLQLFHYLKSEGSEAGNLIYICRDDLRLMEFTVLNPGPVEEEDRQAVEVGSD